MTSRVRGTIIKTPDGGPGLLVADGQQKSFTLEGVWKSAVTPAVNMPVDVELDASGSITSLTAVDPQQVAKERLQQIGNLAQGRGKEAAEIARQGIGALAARMGTATLGAATLLVIAWFFLTALTIRVDVTNVSGSFTFWHLVGLDPHTDILSASASHGLFGLLGLLSIAAPFARPFVRHPKAGYLYAMPLGFLVIAVLVIRSSLNTFFEQMGGSLAEASQLVKFSFGLGAYVLAATSVYLAWLVFKRTPAAGR
jgi:hypothetical protein